MEVMSLSQKRVGQVLITASLQHRTAMTVRPRDGKVSTSDGALAETVGALLILEARDLNDAVRVASLHPAARTGEHLGWAVEIRPIEMFEQP